MANYHFMHDLKSWICFAGYTFVQNETGTFQGGILYKECGQCNRLDCFFYIPGSDPGEESSKSIVASRSWAPAEYTHGRNQPSCIPVIGTMYDPGKCIASSIDTLAPEKQPGKAISTSTSKILIPQMLSGKSLLFSLGLNSGMAHLAL